MGKMFATDPSGKTTEISDLKDRNILMTDCWCLEFLPKNIVNAIKRLYKTKRLTPFLARAIGHIETEVENWRGDQVIACLDDYYGCTTNIARAVIDLCKAGRLTVEDLRAINNYLDSEHMVKIYATERYAEVW
jgi:hypothetical protein